MRSKLEFNESTVIVKKTEESKFVQFLITHRVAKNKARASMLVTLVSIFLLLLAVFIVLTTIQGNPEKSAPDPDWLLSQ